MRKVDGFKMSQFQSTVIAISVIMLVVLIKSVNSALRKWFIDYIRELIGTADHKITLT